MSFTRWLNMNNAEKMKILLYLLPVIIVAYGIDKLVGDWVVISYLIGVVTTLFLTGVKYMYYVNIIAQKYNKKLQVSLKQSLIQCAGALVVNGLFAGLFIVIAVSIWLVALATMSLLMFLVAIISSVIGVIAFLTIDKLSLFVLLANVEDNNLTFKGYVTKFPDVYQAQFKIVLTTTIKAILYSFIAVLILSIITIIPLNTNITWLLIIISLLVSFVVYWIDITAVQYLIREYTR